MAIYSLMVETNNDVNATPVCDAMARASNYPKVMEICSVNTSVNINVLGIARSTNNPVQSGSKAVLPEDPNDPTGLTRVAQLWTTAPTVTNFLRRIAVTGADGSGFLLTWPRGVALAVNTSLVVWNLAANGGTNAGLMQTSFVVDE